MEHKYTVLLDINIKYFDLLRAYQDIDISREMSLAITKLEESIMWADKAIKKKSQDKVL